MILIMKKMVANKINYYLSTGDQKHAHLDQRYYIQPQREHVLKK